MKKLIVTILACVPFLAIAAGPTLPLDKANNDLSDKESLKRGFEAYLQNCLGCHSLQYQRYNRTFRDLGISDEEGKAKYMPTGKNVGDHIQNSMPKKDAATWFGTTPPDLTLMARLKSPDYIYTYMRSFYQDPERPFGVNNKVFKDVGMPHVLQGLQGLQTLDENGELTAASGGQMSPEEYDEYIRDLTNFLEYVGEPNKLEREQMGYYVIGFLLILLVFSYLLKKEYWRDVH